jgi:hypothetical protein
MKIGSIMIANEEMFIIDDYNDIPMIIRYMDGFFNASKIYDREDRKFEEYIQTKEWKDIVQGLSKHLQDYSNKVYELTNDYPPEVSGYYVHPELKHSVCMQCNTEYVIKVRKLMALKSEIEEFNRYIIDKLY